MCELYYPFHLFKFIRFNDSEMHHFNTWLFFNTDTEQQWWFPSMGASKSLPLVRGNFSNKTTSFSLTCFNISTFPCKIGVYMFMAKNHCFKLTTHSHIFVSYFCRSSTPQSSLKMLLLRESKLSSSTRIVVMVLVMLSS